MSVFWRIFLEVFLAYVLCMLLETRHVLGQTDVMFPSGRGEGDSFLKRSDEYASDAIPLSRTFTFLNENYQSLYISVNGIISFLRPLPYFPAELLPIADSPPLISPYLADADTRDYGTISFNQFSWTDANKGALFDRVNDIIRESFVDQQDFQAEWVFMVSWNKVGFNGQYDASLRNTFQCLLVSGDSFSGVIFNYKQLSWTSDIFHGGNPFTGVGGDPAQAGFNAGDGRHAYTLPNSHTEAIINMPLQSNINVPGRFVFRVDLPEVRDPTCTTEGHLQLYPSIGSMLGGHKVHVQGPCFNSTTTNVICKFKDTLSVATIESSLRASCIVPTSFTLGEVDVGVSLDGGVTFPFKGTFQVEAPSQTTPHVFKVDEDDWLNADEFEIVWDDVLTGVSKVDVIVYSYLESREEGEVVWTSLEQLAYDLDYGDGGANLARPVASRPVNERSELMGVIKVVENIGDSTIDNRIPQAIWSTVDSLQWLYPQNSTDWCKEWSTNEAQDQSFLDARPFCPCELRQAKADFARYTTLPECDDAAWGKFSGNCADRPGAFHCVISRDVSEYVTGQECCYNEMGTLLEARLGTSGFGRSHRYHYTGAKNPSGDVMAVPFFSHFYNDVIPEMQCCRFSALEEGIKEDEAQESCDRYQKLRPSYSCWGYEVAKPASVFGASHFATFDGLNYTFNGRGEYTLLQSEERGLVIQGRFDTMKTQGQTTSPSILTALAIKQGDSDIVHIQASSQRRIHVFIRRENERFFLVDASQALEWRFSGVDVFYGDSLSPWDVRLVFVDGVGVRIKATGKSLRSIVIIPPDFRGKTSGLLGTWDDDGTDDFTLANGDTLPVDAADSRIYTTFGPSWSIPSEEALFYYLPGYSTDTYSGITQNSSDPEPEEATTDICEGNALCNSDFAVSMGNEEFALATLAAQEELRETRMDLAKGDRSFLLCPEVVAPTNGGIQVSLGRNVGDFFEFSCEYCYDMIGSPTVTCSYDLEWSETAPICRRNANTTCSLPYKHENTSVTMGECNRTALYTCDEGFKLVGQELITCANGSWMQEAPKCQLDVPEEEPTSPSLNNTHVSGSDHLKKPGKPKDSSDDDDDDNDVNQSVPKKEPKAEKIQTTSGFLLWWLFLLFVVVLVIILIITFVLLCCGFRQSAESGGTGPNKSEYELVTSA